MSADKKKMVAIRFDPADIEWFDKHFNIRGAKQWFFENCLKELIKLHKAGKFEAPVDLLSITVPEVVKDL